MDGDKGNTVGLIPEKKFCGTICSGTVLAIYV